MDVVMAVDLWDAACVTYGLNHPRTVVCNGDLRAPEIQAKIIETARFAGGFDVVLGGIPCQWLSVRRNVGNKPKAKELAQERETLRSVLSLVGRLRPRWWCLEDVKGLAAELPPGTPWVEIDAADWSPQRRKRIYVGRFPWPPTVTPANAATLSSRLNPGPYRIGRRTFGRTPEQVHTFSRQTCYGAELNKKAPTICCTASRRDPEYVIVDPTVPGGMRQIEWQEAAALQGFPSNYLFYGSPGDIWTQIGQAIQIETGKAILGDIAREARQ
jgi:site-specific DNA-cytosine methylase